MTTQPEPLPDGVYCVATADDLQSKTQDGWVVVQVLREKVQVPLHESVPAPVYMSATTPTYNGYPPSNAVNTIRHKSTTIHKYLLRRSAEVGEGLAKLQMVIDERQLEVSKLTTDLKERIARIDVLEKESAKAQADIVRLNGELATQRVEVGTARTETNRMKADFGKVWVAVGDNEMKRILGGDAVNPSPAPERERLTAYERIANNAVE